MSASKPMFLRFGRLSAYHAADDVVFLLESEVMPYIEQLRAELERVKTVYHDLVETAFSLSDETRGTHEGTGMVSKTQCTSDACWCRNAENGTGSK